MKIVVAPDSYKGSVSAVEVAQAMERGILKLFPSASIQKLPIADGGEGTVDALVTATGGQIRYSEVCGLFGERISAAWGVLGNGNTAVIEMASASGLPLVPVNRRDPSKLSSFGTGELIRAALDAGFRRIIIGIGGSATNDAGAGMARALGARFFAADGSQLADGGTALAALVRIDLTELDTRLQETEIIVACDVANPLCGPQGASVVFGPQKGATPAMVVQLDAALARFAECAKQVTGRDVAEIPGVGAAGGLGAGLLFFTQARLRPGIEIVLDAVDFSAAVKNADYVITGEGRTDFQTVFGKAPVGVAKVAKMYGVPVFCVSGGIGEGADDVLTQGIDVVMSICDGPMSLDECMTAGSTLIESATVRLCRILKAAQPR